MPFYKCSPPSKIVKVNSWDFSKMEIVLLFFQNSIDVFKLSSWLNSLCEHQPSASPHHSLCPPPQNTITDAVKLFSIILICISFKLECVFWVKQFLAKEMNRKKILSIFHFLSPTPPENIFFSQEWNFSLASRKLRRWIRLEICRISFVFDGNVSVCSWQFKTENSREVREF